MIKWKLYEYKSIVDLFLTKCSQDMHEKLMQRLYTLLEKGNECKYPASEPLRDGLFALRGKADNRQARLIYYFNQNREIIFVHAIFKARREIRRHDIEIAKRNRKIIEEGKEQAYGLNLTH